MGLTIYVVSGDGVLSTFLAVMQDSLILFTVLQFSDPPPPPHLCPPLAGGTRVGFRCKSCCYCGQVLCADLSNSCEGDYTPVCIFNFDQSLKDVMS